MVLSRVALGIVLACCGCGRLAFDQDQSGRDASEPRVCDLPVGHDEDGDGVDDACDGCPHIADAAQIDTDGDGVDDACDPEPDNPRQTIAVFDPMTAPRPELTINGASSVYANDALTVDARDGYSYLALDHMMQNDVLELRATVVRGTAASHQLTITGADDNTGALYYCELQDDPSGFFWRLTYTYDTVDFQMPDEQVLTGTLDAATVTLRMVWAVPDARCDSDWPTTRELAGTIPSDINGDSTLIGIGGELLTLDYFIVIQTH
ncbi:MAG TPA: hypothetical protein VGM90_09940 [Kofleriaceae bacterium]